MEFKILTPKVALYCSAMCLQNEISKFNDINGE